MSRIGLPNSTSAGDDLVIGSTVFLYDRMACWNLSTSREPDGLQLSAMIRLTCFTPSSARQLECGLATDERRCWTPQSFKNCCVAPAVNSGPPSEESCSAMPNVEKMLRSIVTSPLAPFSDRNTIGQ